MSMSHCQRCRWFGRWMHFWERVRQTSVPLFAVIVLSALSLSLSSFPQLLLEMWGNLCTRIYSWPNLFRFSTTTQTNKYCVNSTFLSFFMVSLSKLLKANTPQTTTAPLDLWTQDWSQIPAKKKIVKMFHLLSQSWVLIDWERAKFWEERLVARGTYWAAIAAPLYARGKVRKYRGTKMQKVQKQANTRTQDWL